MGNPTSEQRITEGATAKFEQGPYGMHIVIIGNPVDGFQYIGPFKTGEDAIAWADRDADIDADWWIAPLEAKDQHERAITGMMEG